MINNIKSVKIGQVWNEGRGATFKDELSDSPQLGSDVALSEPISAEFTVIRLKEGLSVILENLHTSTDQVCARCLKQFNHPIDVKSTERLFYADAPGRDYDPLEVFLIDKQDMAIDLSEMLRQEMLLQFPMIPVCSERCKGLCPDCHVDLNTTAKHQSGCQAKSIEKTADTQLETHKPFANLKDLIK